MLRLPRSKDALTYLRQNIGKINALELAFADYRLSSSGVPEAGFFMEIREDVYLWRIHNHYIRIRQVPDDERLHMRIEEIQPALTK